MASIVLEEYEHNGKLYEEVELDLDCHYYFKKGEYGARPEDCYPDEFEFEIEQIYTEDFNLSREDEAKLIEYLEENHQDEIINQLEDY